MSELFPDEEVTAIQKFRSDMSELGFQQANVMVHTLDRVAILAQAKKLQGSRLVTILSERSGEEDYGEVLDLLANRRKPRGIPRLVEIDARKKDAQERDLTRLGRLSEIVSKINLLSYERDTKLARLKADEENPELYYLYDEVASAAAHIYAHGLWASGEWELINAGRE